MEQTHFLKNYDWVTLLIGVNNQYRERSVENYHQEFTDLIQKAIGLCGNKPGQVIVLIQPLGYFFFRFKLFFMNNIHHSTG